MKKFLLISLLSLSTVTAFSQVITNCGYTIRFTDGFYYHNFNCDPNVPDLQKCVTISIQIQIPNATYLWSNGSTCNQVYFPGDGRFHVFHVTVTNDEGCSSTFTNDPSFPSPYPGEYSLREVVGGTQFYNINSNLIDPCEPAKQTWYRDADTDGYGDPSSPLEAADKPDGYVSDKTDCNDGDIRINPATVWYQDEDGDGYTAGVTFTGCVKPDDTYYLIDDPHLLGSGDENDQCASVTPGTNGLRSEAQSSESPTCKGKITFGTPMTEVGDFCPAKYFVYFDSPECFTHWTAISPYCQLIGELYGGNCEKTAKKGESIEFDLPILQTSDKYGRFSTVVVQYEVNGVTCTFAAYDTLEQTYVGCDGQVTSQTVTKSATTKCIRDGEAKFTYVSPSTCVPYVTIFLSDVDDPTNYGIQTVPWHGQDMDIIVGSLRAATYEVYSVEGLDESGETNIIPAFCKNLNGTISIPNLGNGKDDFNVNVTPHIQNICEGGTASFSASPPNADSYKWYDLNREYESAIGHPLVGTDQIFSTELSGGFFVEVTKGSCTKGYCCAEVRLKRNCNPHGPHRLEDSDPDYFQSGIFLYPNPAINQIHYDLFAESGAVTINLFNTIGQRVLAKSIQMDESGKTQDDLDISNLPAGIYLLQAETESGEVLQQKFMKE